jgi:hypothetical protein
MKRVGRVTSDKIPERLIVKKDTIGVVKKMDNGKDPLAPDFDWV